MSARLRPRMSTRFRRPVSCRRGAMSGLVNKKSFGRLLALSTLASLPLGGVHAAAPGIIGSGTGGSVTFNLTAAAANITQPDGSSIYSWGYGCNGAPAGFLPAAMGISRGANCQSMQLPGPTLIVHANDVVTVNLTN